MSTPAYPGPTTPMIGALLRHAAERSRGLLITRLGQAGYSDLRYIHFTVFQFPGPHGVRPRELAARLGMTKQALAPLLNDVEALGYLERRPDPEDGRGKVLWLTERGLAFMGDSKRVVQGIEDEWAALLGEERFAVLKGALQELNEQPI